MKEENIKKSIVDDTFEEIDKKLRILNQETINLIGLNKKYYGILKKLIHVVK